MVSTRIPQMTPVIDDAFGLSRASAKKSSKVVPAARWPFSSPSSKPVSQLITWSRSACVRPFFSTLVT
jgi:hypothetical protein